MVAFTSRQAEEEQRGATGNRRTQSRLERYLALWEEKVLYFKCISVDEIGRQPEQQAILSFSKSLLLIDPLCAQARSAKKQHFTRVKENGRTQPVLWGGHRL